MQLTQTIIHELLLYDPFTRALTWRARKGDRWKQWNADTLARVRSIPVPGSATDTARTSVNVLLRIASSGYG
jgi:hypothetical protein